MAQDLEPPPPKRNPQGTGTRKIRADDLVQDITAGMSDPKLLEKYQLQPRQLEFMLRKLVDAGRAYLSAPTSRGPGGAGDDGGHGQPG